MTLSSGAGMIHEPCNYVCMEKGSRQKKQTANAPRLKQTQHVQEQQKGQCSQECCERKGESRGWSQRRSRKV